MFSSCVLSEITPNGFGNSLEDNPISFKVQQNVIFKIKNKYVCKSYWSTQIHA